MKSLTDHRLVVFVRTRDSSTSRSLSETWILTTVSFGSVGLFSRELLFIPTFVCPTWNIRHKSSKGISVSLFHVGLSNHHTVVSVKRTFDFVLSFLHFVIGFCTSMTLYDFIIPVNSHLCLLLPVRLPFEKFENINSLFTYR